MGAATVMLAGPLPVPLHETQQGSTVSAFAVTYFRLPHVSEKTRLHRSSSFRLWLTMLCSWLSAAASSETVISPSISFSMMASLVGLARAEKKPNTTRLAFKLILVFENRASYMWLLSQKVTQYIITKDYSEFSLNIRIMKLLYAINGFCS